MKIVLLAGLFIFLSGCFEIKKRECMRYKVWVGSQVMAVGYDVNEIKKENGLYVIQDSLVPETSVLAIKKNECWAEKAGQNNV